MTLFIYEVGKMSLKVVSGLSLSLLKMLLMLYSSRLIKGRLLLLLQMASVALASVLPLF